MKKALPALVVFVLSIIFFGLFFLQKLAGKNKINLDAMRGSDGWQQEE